jgi:hypothetical protein
VIKVLSVICEEQSDEAIHRALAAIEASNGLLRFARNDEAAIAGLTPCKPSTV